MGLKDRTGERERKKEMEVETVVAGGKIIHLAVERVLW